MKQKDRTITIAGTAIIDWSDRDEYSRLLAKSIFRQLEDAKTGKMNKDDAKSLLAKIIQIGLRQIFNDPDKMKELKMEPFKIIIDGVQYNCTLDKGDSAPEPFKAKWPTDIESVIEAHDYNLIAINVNDQDHGKLSRISDCIDAARAINGDWEPDWEDDELKYRPVYEYPHNVHVIGATNRKSLSFVWFPTKEACKHFIDHFGDIWLEAIG